MTEEERDKAKAACRWRVSCRCRECRRGRPFGGVELAARGAVTGLSAGLVIGLGAAAGPGSRTGSIVFSRSANPDFR